MKRSNQPTKIAVVEDDASTRRIIRAFLEGAGYEILECSKGADLLASAEEFDAVCLDLGLEDMDGLELLKQLKSTNSAAPVLVLTGDHDTATAVSAMKSGAYDYLLKPRDYQRLLQVLHNALAHRDLTARVEQLTSELEERRVLHTMIGQSQAMRALSLQVERVLESDVPVAIFGETGTGKELVAKAIHDGGRRRKSPFIAINCASIPENLLESELFGHEKGSFTGANALYRGRFEQANGGTLFLDELGEMSTSTQASLLRTLQERCIRRVGGTTEIPVNVRLVSATHRDLEDEVKLGRFRQDLYFRLVVYPLRIAPLRERQEDVPLLVGHFLRKYQSEIGRKVERITPDALEALCRYPWPGNVRELENVVHRAVLSCDGKELSLLSLPQELRQQVKPKSPGAPSLLRKLPPEEADAVLPLREVERLAILNALRVTRGKIGVAANLLGIGRATLYRRLAEFGVDPALPLNQT